MKGHLKHMVIGAGAIVVVLMLFGVELGDALPYAALLACPLMMIGMMVMMRTGHGRAPADGHEHGPHCAPASQEKDGVGHEKDAVGHQPRR